MKRVQKAISAALFLGLVGCGAPMENAVSDLDITNGIAADQSQFPAVVQLTLSSGWSRGICTGTWVNDHQVLTAAHCVYNKPTIYAGRIRAINYFRQSEYSMQDNNGVNNLDLAIINFPAGSAPATRQLVGTGLVEGDAVVIAGFGNNIIAKSGSGGITGSGSGQLRYGKNEIANNDDGMLQIVGVPKANYTVGEDDIALGDYSATGSGDSGGPIFHNGKLAGVTSGGGLGETEDGTVLAVGLFTDLTSETSQAFLAKHLD